MRETNQTVRPNDFKRNFNLGDRRQTSLLILSGFINFCSPWNHQKTKTNRSLFISLKSLNITNEICQQSLRKNATLPFHQREGLIPKILPGQNGPNNLIYPGNNHKMNQNLYMLVWVLSRKSQDATEIGKTQKLNNISEEFLCKFHTSRNFFIIYNSK